ncbi:hypothetical protein C8D87_104609 [Lentzea atacamensis]|uniref:Cellulase (Glycosyl hydrolase family 5) n=2 Tax=Lentzea atacamensis TaxID=531938 RepID=A0ABX9E8N4_9PSEU|nr:hypothetical protein C8D87_104609 [Lentzea atacamensis]
MERMSTWGKAIVLAFALLATLVAPAHASNQISVSAAEVTLPPGQNTASVGVSWHTDGNQTVQIWIRETGKAAKLWRHEVNGSATWPYLHAGTTTTFELRGGPNFATVLGTTSSTGRLPGRLSADRTHLALAPGTTGTIDLSWATELSDAQVWVSHNGNPQKLYAQGPSGTGRITWISRGTTVFTLWSGTGQEHLLDTLVVTADSGATASFDRPVVVDPDGNGTATVRWTGGEARLVNDDGTETVLSGGSAAISTRGADRKVVRVYEGGQVVTHASVTILRDGRGWAGFDYLPEHEKRYQEYLDDAVWPQVRAQVAHDFDVMASTGGTVARVVLWPEKSTNAAAQARNLADLAGIAKQRGIRLVVAFANSWLTNPNWDDTADSRKKWAEFAITSANWMNTYITALEPGGAVLYYDLQNETSGVRGNQSNLQSAYVAMVYDRTAAPRGKRGVSVMHASTDGADLAAALVGKPMDFVDVHGYGNLDLLDGAVRGLREKFPASAVIVGEIGKSAPGEQQEREQADYTGQTLQTTDGLQVPITMAWELYDDPRTPPHPNSIAFGYLARDRAKPGFGVLCSRWSLVPDCGAPREATSAQPTTLELSATVPVRPGTLAPNAILRGNGTARLVITELDPAGREVASTLTEPVAIGTAGLNYLRHQQSDVRLRDETRSVRIAVRAEGSTRLQVDALTASVR